MTSTRSIATRRVSQAIVSPGEEGVGNTAAVGCGDDEFVQNGLGPRGEHLAGSFLVDADNADGFSEARDRDEVGGGNGEALREVPVEFQGVAGGVADGQRVGDARILRGVERIGRRPGGGGGPGSRLVPGPVAGIVGHGRPGLLGQDLAARSQMPPADPGVGADDSGRGEGLLFDSKTLAWTITAGHRDATLSLSGALLWGGVEPDLPMLRRAVETYGGLQDFREFIWCGFGEPTFRLDLMLEAAPWLRSRGARIRLNTNGHACMIHGRDVLPDLSTAVDAISISMNAPRTRRSEPPAVLPAREPGAM